MMSAEKLKTVFELMQLIRYGVSRFLHHGLPVYKFIVSMSGVCVEP